MLDFKKKRSVADLLVQHGVVSRSDMEGVAAAARSTSQPLRVTLERLGFLQSKDWAEFAAKACALEKINIEAIPISLPSDTRLSDDYLQRNAILPLELTDTRAHFAVADPFDDTSLNALRMIYGTRLSLSVATEHDIEAGRERAKTSRPAVASEEVGQKDAIASEEFRLNEEQLTDLANNAPTIRYLDSLFARAIDNRATDIHIEIQDHGPVVRFRIDGELVATEPPSRQLYPGVISRLKIFSGMDISERRLPQDGRIRQRISGRETDMRVASAPTIHGEAMVLRVLDNEGHLRRFADLKLPNSVADAFSDALSQPNGLILLTGPTGSGKTTTLHAALNSLDTGRLKIMTIEDPVEIQSAGLQQFEVNHDLGWTFAAALRTMLRHNPDVIMVGEIRDTETAGLAVRAAMTGHLVLSTLHTNSAAEAVLRMVDMGIADHALRAVLRLSAGQRLVRKLCTSCAAPLSPDAQGEVVDLLRAVLADDDAINLDQINPLRPVGCKACNTTGFHGRQAVFETLGRDDLNKTLEGQPCDAPTMGKVAFGMVARGETSLEEVVRVLGEGAFVL